MPRLKGAAFNATVKRDARGRFMKVGAKVDLAEAAKPRLKPRTFPNIEPVSEMDTLRRMNDNANRAGRPRQSEKLDGKLDAAFGPASKAAAADAIRAAADDLRGTGEKQDERYAAQLDGVARQLERPDGETSIADALAEVRLINKPPNSVRQQWGVRQNSTRLGSLSRRLSALDKQSRSDGDAAFGPNRSSTADAVRPDTGRPNAVDASRFTGTDKLAAARVMFGDDESTWPAHAKRDAAKLRKQADSARAARVDAAKADIRAAVQRLQREPGGWVGLAAVRDELGERHNRHDVDQALRELERNPDVNIVPESNQKVLTQADRDSAVTIGDQRKHAISIAAAAGDTVDRGALLARYREAADEVAMLDSDRMNSTHERAVRKELADAKAALQAAGIDPQQPRPRRFGGRYTPLPPPTTQPTRATSQADVAELARKEADLRDAVRGGMLIRSGLKTWPTRLTPDPEQTARFRADMILRTGFLPGGKPASAADRAAAEKLLRPTGAAPAGDDRVARIERASTLAEANTVLDGMTAADLRKFAADNNLPMPSRAKTKPQLRFAIVDLLVGGRLSQEGMFRDGSAPRAASAAPLPPERARGLGLGRDQLTRIPDNRAAPAPQLRRPPAPDRGAAPETVARWLDDTDDTPAAREYLSGLTAARLQQIAEALGIRARMRGTKPQVVDRLLQFTVGGRSTTRGINML